MESYWSRDYSVGASGGFWFGVASGYGVGSVVPITTHLYSQIIGRWLDGGDFVSYQNSDDKSRSHPKNTNNLLIHIRKGMINSVLIVVAEVVLVLGTPTYPPRKLVLSEIDHISIIK